MRLYEWLTLAFLSTFTVLAFKRQLPLRRRGSILAAAAAGVGGLILLRATLLRDWLPLALIPLCYWQTGYFIRPLDRRFQLRLHTFDQKLLGRFPALGAPVRLWLELSYLLVYPMVPAGLIALYAAGKAECAPEFWNVVLPPAYLCYGTFPFVQTLPPRAVEGKAETTKMRDLNLFVIRHVSIQANTFPSGHVAASVAIALELLRHAPAAGVAFLALAIGIAAGAFLGRYHYAIDVLIGAAMAIISFIVFAIIPE